MAPKKFVAPFQQKPDLNTPPAVPAEVDDVVLEAMQNIILEDTPYAKVQQLASGTVRRDHLQKTDAQRAEERADARLRRQQRQTALGSNLDGEVDDEDLE